MSGASATVQAAAFTALTAGVTLAPVFQHVPQGQGYPVVIIVGAKEAASDFTSKGDDDVEVTLTVRAIVEGEANKPAFDIQEQVKAALSRQVIKLNGWVMEFIFTNTDDLAALPEDGSAGLAYIVDGIYAVKALRDS